MNFCRPCGCKGKRSCLVCEKDYDITPASFISDDKKTNGYVFCHLCGKAWPGWNADVSQSCPTHNGESILISGIFVKPNFITNEEKNALMRGINSERWDLSQSGRRKQNYGPKCNFKKNKIQMGNFQGFPNYSRFVHKKFESLSILKNFNVIEQCTLEYDPKKGASIDPHVDDCWIWGERVVTLNVLGNAFLTMTKFIGDFSKYNLEQVKLYPRTVDENGFLVNTMNTEPFIFEKNNDNSERKNITLRVFMPEKSLIVLYGSARYEWEHFILREDIKSLRVCIAYREFTPPYLPGGEKENLGYDILNKSKKYFGEI